MPNFGWKPGWRLELETPRQRGSFEIFVGNKISNVGGSNK